MAIIKLLDAERFDMPQFAIYLQSSARGSHYGNLMGTEPELSQVLITNRARVPCGYREDSWKETRLLDGRCFRKNGVES